MDTKTFLSAIRQVIKEEVSKAIRSELKQILSENTTKRPADKQVINHGINLHKQTNARPVNKNQKSFSTNPLINSILNDTAVNMDPTEMYESGPAVTYSNPLMMEDYDRELSFTSRDSRGFGMMQQMMQPTSNAIPTTDIEGRPVNREELPEAVTNALTRDYSALMKAIDKKKGK